MKITGLLIFAFILAVVLPIGSIPAQQDFEEWMTEDDWEGNIAKDQAEFEEFMKADSLAFEAYKAEIEKKWKQFQASSKPEWVTYGKNKDTKGVVNFEKGTIEVEAIVEVSEPNSVAKAKELISNHIKEIVEVSEDEGEMTESGEKELAENKIEQLKKIKPKDQESKEKLESKIEEAKEVLSGAAQKASAGASVLKGMIKTEGGKLLSKLNANLFAKEASTEAKVEDSSFYGNDGVERIKVKVEIPMVPDHLKKRAERYLPDVKKFCNKYDLDVAMVMGLMHAESYFNPKAKSHVPAYGLMQLVPWSGGRDAYRFVHKQDKKPSARYLYNPTNNIELGTAYLYKMRTYEFKNVTNSQNALYCIICAYNTGAGNVAKAMTGKTRLGAAVEKINKLTPEQLYEKFRRDLPYEETRKYIKKVTENAANYVAWR